MKKRLNLFLAIILSLSCLIGPASASSIEVDRITGRNAQHSSALVSNYFYLSADLAIIASADSYPDSLVASVLAGYEEVPLLMVSENQVSAEVKEELKRLGTKEVYIVGGPNTISGQVEEDLKGLGLKTARLWGETRYQTSDKINEEISKNFELEPGLIYYADGRNFPDALAAAPLVVGTGGLLKLNDGSDLNQGIAIGGPKSIPGQPEERIAGATRYETAALIAGETPYNKAILVNGSSFQEALVGSAIAASFEADVILTDPAQLSQPAQDLLDYYTRIIIIGDTKLVSAELEEKLRKYSPSPIDPAPKGQDPVPEEPAPPSQEPGPADPNPQRPTENTDRQVSANPSQDQVSSPSNQTQVVDTQTSQGQGTELLGDIFISKEALYSQYGPHVQEAVDKIVRNSSGPVKLTMPGFISEAQASDMTQAIIDIISSDLTRTDLFIYSDGLKLDGKHIRTNQGDFSELTLTPKPITAGANPARLKSFTRAWVQENITSDMSQKEKAQRIYEYVVNQATYNPGNLPMNNESINSSGISVYIPEAIVFGNGGVCEAYAKLYYLLAREAGLEARYVRGTAEGLQHAWNIVKVDGTWYYVDTTHGNYDGIDYDYFLFDRNFITSRQVKKILK